MENYKNKCNMAYSFCDFQRAFNAFKIFHADLFPQPSISNRYQFSTI